MPKQDSAIDTLRQAVRDNQSKLRRDENQTVDKLRQVIRENQAPPRRPSLQELVSSSK